MTVTWRELITEEMPKYCDSWDQVIGSAGDEFFDVEFDDGFGAEEGKPFTVWTHDRVYFPVSYDGAETCASASRHPDGVPTRHIGS